MAEDELEEVFEVAAALEESEDGAEALFPSLSAAEAEESFSSVVSSSSSRFKLTLTLNY